MSLINVLEINNRPNFFLEPINNFVLTLSPDSTIIVVGIMNNNIERKLTYKEKKMPNC